MPPSKISAYGQNFSENIIQFSRKKSIACLLNFHVSTYLCVEKKEKYGTITLYKVYEDRKESNTLVRRFKIVRKGVSHKMFNLYTAIVLTALFLLLITATDILTNRLITKEMKKWAVLACLLIAGSLLGECVGVLTNGAAPSLIVLHQIGKLVEFCCAPAIGVAVAMAYGVLKWPKIAIAAAVAHAVFECISLRFHWVFRIDSQNIYHRESLYFIYIAAFILSIILCFSSVIRSGKEYQTGIDGVLVLTLLMLFIGVGIQFIYADIRIDFLCIAIGNMLLYSRCCKIVLQLDAVTCLLNRRCYDTALGNIGSQAVLLFFDINRFKLVNDTYGHSVGDLCLKEIGKQLRAVYGKYGSCYRVGGDEFCVILDSHFEQLEELNGQFLAAVEALRKEDPRIPDIAYGYAYYNADTCHIQKAIEDADDMMYRNKHADSRAAKSSVS